MKWLNHPGREAGVAGRCEDWRLIHTYVRLCICFICCICFLIQILLSTSLRESRKHNLYDVEIWLSTNQQWTVALYRRGKRHGCCVGCCHPVVSGLGCVVGLCIGICTWDLQELPSNQNQPINIFSCSRLNPLSCLSASKYWTRFVELPKPSCSYHFEMYIQRVCRQQSCLLVSLLWLYKKKLPS